MNSSVSHSKKEIAVGTSVSTLNDSYRHKINGFKSRTGIVATERERNRSVEGILQENSSLK